MATTRPGIMKLVPNVTPRTQTNNCLPSHVGFFHVKGAV